MASKADLVRIGREGFELIDQFMDKKGRNAAAAASAVVRKSHVFTQETRTRQVCIYQYQPQKSNLYQVQPSYEKMNTYEVVQYRDDGVTVMDYSKRNSAPNPPMFY